MPIMTHQNAQKRAPLGVAQIASRAEGIRYALLDATLLRREAELVLATLPLGCDLLAWSPEGFTIAAVSSVLADEAGREVNVHRASLLAPLAESPQREDWTWVAVEELLGLGPAREWAVAWARAEGGRQHHAPVLVS